jgi:hypothetical protein
MATSDGQMQLATAQAFTADAGTTNVYDLSNARDFAEGREGFSIYIKPTVAADHTTGDETYAFALRTDDNAAMGSPTSLRSWTVLYTELALTKIVELRIPPGMTYERYIDVLYDGGGTTPTLTADVWIGPSGLGTSMAKYPNAVENF